VPEKKASSQRPENAHVNYVCIFRLMIMAGLKNMRQNKTEWREVYSMCNSGFSLKCCDKIFAETD